MKESGVVKKIGNGEAFIEVLAPKACIGCKKCGMAFPRELTVKADTLAGAKVGDTVEIEIASSSLMGVYLLLYGLPLVLFVSIIVIVYYFTSNPLLSFIPALIASILSCFIGLRLIKRNLPLTCISHRAN